MGVKAKTMHGSRAQLIIDGSIVGIFNSCSYGVTYDAQAIYVLGRFNAAEIALTGMEAVGLSRLAPQDALCVAALRRLP